MESAGVKDTDRMAAPSLETVAIREPDILPGAAPGAGSAPPAPPARLGWRLEGLLAHVPLTLLFTWPLALNLGGNGLAPGQMVEDRAQNLWNLWWVKVALLDRQINPFMTDYIWYPTPVSLYFHTLNIFNGLLSLPFQPFMSLPAILSGIVLFSFIVAGWGAYLLVYYILQRRLTAVTSGVLGAGALLGSVAFTYSAYHIATQRGQLQLVSLEWVPFYALFMLRTVHDWPLSRDRRAVGRWLLRGALPAALFLFLVALVDWYYVMYMVLFTLLYGLYVAGRAWFQGDRSRAAVRAAGEPLLRLAAVGALFAVLTGPILLPMVREARTESYMRPVPGIAFINSADLLAYFLPPLDHQVWGVFTQRIRWEWPVGVQRYEVYFGYVALALAAVGLLAWRGGAAPHPRPLSPPAGRGELVPDSALDGHTEPVPAQEAQSKIPLPSRLFWLAMIVIFFLLSLGPVLQVGGVPVPEVPMLYGVIERIPGFNISRSPDRFDMPLTLCLGVLVGYGTAALAGWRPRRIRSGIAWAAALSTGLIALIFVELWPVPYAQPPAPIYRYYEQVLGKDPADYAIIELPPQDDYWHGAYAMYYQTAHHKRIFGGYISREFAHPFMENTAGFREFKAGTAPSDMFVDPLDARLTALAQYDARLVVVYKVNLSRPTKPVAVDLAHYRALIAGTLGLLADTPPVYSDDQVEVYAVPPPARHAPYLVLGDSWYRFEAPDGHRWMRGQAATLQVVSLDARAATLVVEAASFHRPRTLTVRVEGQAAPAQQLTVGPDVATYRLGPFPLQAGITTLHLSTTDPPESPAGVGVNEDARPLTFMFRQVRLDE
jgi:hypothetical protein